jgi:threonine synthase
MTYSFLAFLQCPRCGSTYDADQLTGTCTCGSPLLARYDLEAVRDAVAPADFAERPGTLWRYHELLPVRSAENIVTFGEGMTPLLPLPRLGPRLGLQRLWMKDDGQLPIRESGWLGADETVVLLNTGAGLKYPETVPDHAPIVPADGALSR